MAAPSTPPQQAEQQLLDDIADLFRDPDLWLDTPNVNLSGRTPRSLLGSSAEQQVRDLVKEIQLGMIS